MNLTSLTARLLATILRVVVLVAMVPVMGLGHAGHVHRPVAAVASAPAALGGHACPDHATHHPAAAGVPAGEHGDKAAATDACPGCCSCPAFAVQAAGTGIGVRGKAARVAPGTDRAHPSVVLEAIAEPPRSFA